MSLPIAVAERILRDRLGEPVKTPTQYVIGFKTPAGRVLALHREAGETRIWFEPPQPPPLDGVALMANSARNSNLNGELAKLGNGVSLRVEIDGEPALHRFLDWYGGAARPSPGGDVAIGQDAFRKAFDRFQQLIVARSGHRFVNFDEGMAARWENYKPRLRARALALLGAETWPESAIGSGEILRRAIDAIEIQDSAINLTNNLVFWQNRFGHANREHRALLEAVSDAQRRRALEQLLFGLFRANADEETTFERLSAHVGAKYPLLAYLYFLKDMDRFMPIQPTGFDRAFRALGLSFSTLRQCTWENYTRFNAVLDALRPMIAAAAGLKSVRLIDAHSFCWIFASLLRAEAEGALDKPSGGKDSGRIVGGREKAIIAMRYSILETVKNSYGQTVERIVKNKELAMTTAELDKLLESLLDVQGNRCALTGIRFHFPGPDADKNLLPSADRIDSNGHYAPGNIQIVCRFVNFWKGASDNEEFRRLLRLVQGGESE